MFWSIIFPIIAKIIDGEAYKAWQAHKLNEAIDAQNKVAAMSDNAAVDELQSKWQR